MEESRIKVVVRKRPISKKEILKSDFDVIEVIHPQTVLVKDTRYNIKKIEQKWI